jgi:hypothetical protein
LSIYKPPDWIGFFSALSDPTRRAILHGLKRRPATINEIAKQFPVSLNANFQTRHGAGTGRTVAAGDSRAGAPCVAAEDVFDGLQGGVSSVREAAACSNLLLSVV